MKNNNSYILQPLLQTIFFVFLYFFTWSILFKHNFIKDHEFWDLTTMYIFICFILMSLLLAVLLFFIKMKSYLLIGICWVCYMLITYDDFKASPKLILIIWLEVLFSMVISKIIILKIKSAADESKIMHNS